MSQQVRAWPSGNKQGRAQAEQPLRGRRTARAELLAPPWPAVTREPAGTASAALVAREGPPTPRGGGNRE
jgi:hypothetical protein